MSATISDSPARGAHVIEVEANGYTIRIYPRTKGSATYFQLADYSSGTRKLRSFADQEKAEKEAKRIAKLMSKGDALGAQMTGAERLEFLAAKKALEGLDVSVSRAAEEYAAAIKKLVKVPLAVAVDGYLKVYAGVIQRPVPDVLEEMIKAKSDNKMKPISDSYLKDLNRLKKFTTTFHCNIEDVTASQIEDFISEVSAEGRTQFNYGRLIRTLFNFAEKRNYLARDQNPFEKIELEYFDDSEIEIFTPTEMRAILIAARPELIPFLAIGAFAGVRHVEMKRLDWSEVGDDYITIQKGKAKTRSRRLVSVLPNLAQWLAPFKKTSGPVVEFEHISKQIGWLVEDVNDILRREAAAAHRPPPKKFEWKHNALRHSFITYRMAETNDENRTAAEAGNSPKMIHGHYRALATREIAKDWFAILPTVREKPAEILSDWAFEEAA